MMYQHDDKNLLLNQINRSDNKNLFLKETIPLFDDNRDTVKQLSRDIEGNIFWMTLDFSLNILANNRFKDTNIYYDNGRIGIGRFPLFNYKVDITVPKNTVMTALHIGDGSFGFSMGNGTTAGFVPEIVGIGSDENDAGLYFVGIAGNDVPSNIPLIILDGRSTYNDKLKNRPILGVTSGNYDKYNLLLDAKGNLIISGNLTIKDAIIQNRSLINILDNLEKEIKDLKDKINN